MKLRTLFLCLGLCVLVLAIGALLRPGAQTTSAATALQVEAGDRHTCARLSDGGGTVKCWGENTNGQLGNGTTTSSSTPVDVCATGSWNGSSCSGSALSGVVAITAGVDHTCALISGASVKCWGENGVGELGDGTFGTDRLNPVTVCATGSGGGCGALGSVTQVSAGGEHTCAVISGGTVKCWGWNSEGDVGDGTQTQRNNPVDVCASGSGAGCSPGAPLTGVSSVSAGAFHTCALMTTSTVKCWGYNYYGQLGDGTSATNRLNPVDAINNSAAIVDSSASVGLYTSLVMDASGRAVVSYYDSTNGDLKVLHCGNANCNAADSVTAPDTGGIVGQYTSIRLDGAGNPVVSYYDASNGELELLHCGNADCTSGNSIATPDTSAIAFTSLALDSDGFPVVFYGAGSFQGYLLHCDDANCSSGTSYAVTGTPTFTAYAGPRALQLDPDGFPVVAYEIDGSIRLLHCGDATCSTGNSTEFPTTGSYPALVLDSSGFPVISYQKSGDLYVLHCNDADCSPGGESDEIADGGTDTVGSYSSIALDTAGRPMISYYDSSNVMLKYVHCGDANCLSGNVIATTLVGSTDTSLALDQSGSPVIAASGGGVLVVNHCGNANCDPLLTGVFVALSPNSLSAGYYHTCVVLTTQGIKCWGANSSGELGNGNQPYESHSPVDVCADQFCYNHFSNGIAVKAGGTYTCGGIPYSVRCWGSNTSGQLADGRAGYDSDTPRNTCVDDDCSGPVANLTFGGDTGYAHGCAVTLQGNVLCAGDNTYGQLGDGGACGSSCDIAVSVVGLGANPTPTPTATPTPTPVALSPIATALNKPWGVFVTNDDGSGAGAEGGQAASTTDTTTVYYAESGDNQIHKNVLKTSTDTVVAGSGGAGGYDCNNCTATGAKLNGPRDVFYTSSGDLYIADTLNCLVRKVSGTTITNVAGVAPTLPSGPTHCGFDGDGTATSKMLNRPSGVAVGPNGDIYIADTRNCLVRKVSGSTMTTVAGKVPIDCPLTGAKSDLGDGGPARDAPLRYPYDVSLLYPGDDLLIAEGADAADGLSNPHNRIRRLALSSAVNVSDPIISTAAGGGTCLAPYTACANDPSKMKLSNPLGVAASDYEIFIAQAGDAAHPIARVHSLTGAVRDAAITGVTVDSVKGVAVNNRQDDGTRTLAITIYGTTSSDGRGAAGYDTGGGDSSTYRPTSSCSALPGIQSIDWVLPATLLGLIAGRRRLRTLFIVLRSTIERDVAAGAL